MKFVSETKLLEMWPPFFVMGVKVVSVAKNYRHLHVRVPLRWYGTNLFGTMFGGWMSAVADPLPALLCQKIFKGTQVWTKRNLVDFLRPAFGDLDCRIDVSEDDVTQIQAALDSRGQATHLFRFPFKDKRGRVVAKCQNVVFIRKKGESAL